MPRRRFASATLNTASTDTGAITSTDVAPPRSVPATFDDGLPLPSLMVFDLDYTLWPFWIDTHVSGRLKPNKDNSGMIDSTGDTFTFYVEVPSILYEAQKRNITMALASRTSAPDLANQMLRAVNIPVPEQYKDEDQEPQKAINFFKFREIYPGAKTRHFKQIQNSTRKEGVVDYKDMLFFDDESRNRDVERELGVTFWLVRDGVTRDEIDKAVWEWRKRRDITKADLKKESEEASP